MHKCPAHKHPVPKHLCLNVVDCTLLCLYRRMLLFVFYRRMLLLFILFVVNIWYNTIWGRRVISLIRGWVDRISVVPYACNAMLLACLFLSCVICLLKFLFCHVLCACFNLSFLIHGVN